MTFSLHRQLLLCLAMVLASLALIIFVQQAALPDALLAGLPWPQQTLLGILLGAATGAGSLVSALRKPDAGAVRRTAESYGRLDLGGLNPVWISLAAGVGEEMLFRAALQPLIGIWLSSLLFLALHSKAYDFRKLDRTALLQAAGVFGMSVVFGLVYRYAGLLASVLFHTVTDILGLYAVRRLTAMSK